MSVLVTGGTGFLGHHLLNSLTRTKGQLVSYSLDKPFPLFRLEHVHYSYGDLLDFNAIAKVIQEFKPNEIYHVGAQSSVGVSHKKPYETIEINVLGSQNILEAARRFSPNAKVILLSSSDVYGHGSGLLDIMRVESDPYLPRTPFASSKSCMELIGKQYFHTWNSHVVIARPFNFAGPAQNRSFVLSNIADQIIKIQHHYGEPVLYTGNLDVSRDVVDVRDVARALILIMGSSPPGEIYNICSGKISTIRELVEEMINIAGIDVEIRRDPNRERSYDQPLLMGNPEKLMRNTGWKPIIDIHDTLSDILSEMNRRILYERNQGLVNV
jgi:GDP-4-dehydro-6-deoxy-D-mannose reductase